MSGDVPGKLPAGKIGKDLECGGVNLDVMNQKFYLLKKRGYHYAALLIIYMGTWTIATPCTLLSPVQLQFLDIAFIQRRRFPSPGTRFLMDWRYLVGIKRIMPYRSCYVTWIQVLVLFHDSPVLQGWRLRSPPPIPQVSAEKAARPEEARQPARI